MRSVKDGILQFYYNNTWVVTTVVVKIPVFEMTVPTLNFSFQIFEPHPKKKKKNFLHRKYLCSHDVGHSFCKRVDLKAKQNELFLAFHKVYTMFTLTQNCKKTNGVLKTCYDLIQSANYSLLCNV